MAKQLTSEELEKQAFLEYLKESVERDLSDSEKYIVKNVPILDENYKEGNITRVEPKYFDDENSRVYECPICKMGEIKIKDNLFYGRCDRCKGTLIDYIPLPHQESFHTSPVQYKLNVGGYGSGKTTASVAEIVEHALSTPNGETVIVANTLAQVKDTVIPELNKFLPPWFLKKKAVMNPAPHYHLINGHEIKSRSSDNPVALRSMNLTAFYIEEGSGVDYSIFDQLTTRLRKKAGIIFDRNGQEVARKYLGIVSTNPDDSWIKDDFLFISDKIVGSKSIDTSVYKNVKNRVTSPHYNSFLSSTRDNQFLPMGFIERTVAGKSQSWIRKYIDCALDIKEGAVYPDLAKYFVEPFPIPKDWKRLGGYDPGFNDPTARPIAAVDPDTGIIYIYNDYYVQGEPISYHAENMKKDTKGLEFLFPFQADPSVEKRNDRDLKTYRAYFREKSGVDLEPANNDILYGIEKVRDYLYAGKLKIFNNCDNIRFEGQNYKYPEVKTRNKTDVPIDRNNHLMDAIRYMISVLPLNPDEFNAFYVKDLRARNNLSVNLGFGNKSFEGDKITFDDLDFEFEEGIYGRRW